MIQGLINEQGLGTVADGVNESGPAICGRSARPHHREIICDEDFVTEDATSSHCVVDTCKSGDISGVEAVAQFSFFSADLTFGLKAFGEDFVGAWVGRGDNLSSMGVLAPAGGSVSQPGGAFE
jgi:hypothetical protein